MTKWEQLQAAILEARKAGDKWKVKVLSTMKGEVENYLKNEKSKNVDDFIESYALKSKKNLEEYKPANYQEEIELLEIYMPRPIRPEEIQAFIELLHKEGVDKRQWMGRVMRNFKGLDPKLVQGLIKEFNN